jgi:Fur family peroxide stress response transcriptional regulator
VNRIDPRQVSRKLSAAKLKVTPQRLAIYAQLLGSEDHPSPESLYQSVKDDLPKLSLATVYKTLDALEFAGLISQLTITNESKRYDANLDSHHHLICTKCRRVIDFTDESMSAKMQDIAYGFRPQEIKVQILGVCASCHNEDTAHQNVAEEQVSSAVKTTTEEENG